MNKVNKFWNCKYKYLLIFFTQEREKKTIYSKLFYLIQRIDKIIDVNVITLGYILVQFSTGRQS